MRKTRAYILGLVVLLSTLWGQASGRYTINADGHQVELADGNLSLTASTFTWTFVSNNAIKGTADVLGGAPANSIDLFGWSGTAFRYWGVSALPGTKIYHGDFLDWGSNAIADDEAGTWETLSADEWAYILNSRYHADQLRGYAQVADQYGLVILRDSSTLTLQPTYSAADWASVAADGAVFLPIAGERDGGQSVDITKGLYWTSTPDGAESAKCLVISAEGSSVTSKTRSIGAAVRLAKRLAQVVYVEDTDCETFDHWSDDESNTDNPRTFAPGEVGITPIMKLKTFTIRGAVNDVAAGSVTVVINANSNN